MTNQYHERVIQTLSVRDIEVYKCVLDEPLFVANFKAKRNTLIYVKQGVLYLPEERVKVDQGQLLVLPEGFKSDLCTLEEHASDKVSFEEFSDFLNKPTAQLSEGNFEAYFIDVDIMVYKVFNLLNILQLPAFRLDELPGIASLVCRIYDEFVAIRIGRRRMLRNLILEITYLMIREMADKKLFEQNFEKNSVFFKDDRLIDIFEYVNQNLDKDLSNKALANVANVSEDYVGQYFKHVTGIRIQDFVEMQRMTKALDYLVNTTGSIREVSAKIGYTDVAYFCRRFKKLNGISAREMRMKLTIDKYSKSY